MNAKPVNVGILPDRGSNRGSGSGGHQAGQVSQGDFVGFQCGKKAERTLPIETTFEEKTDVAAAVVGQVLARRSFQGFGFDQGIHQVGNEGALMRQQ